jgi:hypothetical protein
MFLCAHAEGYPLKNPRNHKFCCWTWISLFHSWEWVSSVLSPEITTLPKLFFSPLTVFCSTPSKAYPKEDPEEELSLCFAETHLIRTQVHHLSFCCCLISSYLHSFLPPAKIHTTNQPLELVVNPHWFSQKVPVWQL